MAKEYHRSNSKEDEMIARQIKGIEDGQEFLRKQMEYIIRLISGDSTLDKLHPTGMVHEINQIKEKLDKLDNDSRGVVNWFNEKDKRKYIINVDLVAWGKVIAWIVAIVGGVIGLIKWFTTIGPNNK